MADLVDKKRRYNTISKTCYGANIIYLFIHVLYLMFFIISKFTALIIVDAAIILIYLLFFLLLKAKKYYLYALCCGNLFFAFVSVTTIMLGFNTGFHFYLIGLCVVSFFTTYFSKNRSPKGTIVWVGLSLAIYLTLYFVTKFNAPYYAIEQWLEITLFTIHAVAVFGFVAVYMLIFVKYAMSLEKKIMYQSRTDELTQINNRYGLLDYLETEEDKSNLVLALFDVDDFKKINDEHGHVTGDFVLKKVGETVSDFLKDSFVCRYGGEEFVIVLKDDESNPFFERLEELRKNIAKEIFEFENLKLNITITIGAVKYEKDLTIEQWIELADKLMYSGKTSGKNKTVIE